MNYFIRRIIQLCVKAELFVLVPNCHALKTGLKPAVIETVEKQCGINMYIFWIRKYEREVQIVPMFTSGYTWSIVM